MPDSGENVRFQVLVNGHVRATGGIETFGVLTFLVDWVRRDPARAAAVASDLPADLDPAEWAGGRVHARLGGLDSVTGRHLEWCWEELTPGDEVSVRVLPPGEFDEPARESAPCEGE